MTNEEYELIKKVIDRDTNDFNICDLRKLKKYLKNSLSKCNHNMREAERRKAIYQLDKQEFKEKKQLLASSLSEYFNERNTYVKNRIYRSLRGYYDYCLGTNIKLYELIMLSKEDLNKLTNIGSKIMEMTEVTLNKDGLSLNIELTSSQIEELKKIDNYTMTMEDIESKKDILKTSFIKFWNDNIDKNDKARYQYNKLACRARDDLYKNSKYDVSINNIKLYEVIVSVQSHGSRFIIDSDTELKLEEFLNKYGLSIKVLITEEQKEILDKKEKTLIR